jgi:hypothetical protein
MYRIEIDDLYLFMVLIGTICFAAWEFYALLPWTDIHTISYWATQYWWLRILIGIVLPIAFGAWFLAHTSKAIIK